MNARQLLHIPWYSTYPTLRWFAVVVFVLCSAGAIAIGTFADGPGAMQGAVALYGCGLIYLWAFFFSLSLLPAIDARQLRLPGISRQIHASLVLYGLLGIAVPLVVPGVGGGTMAVLALFSAVGLIFALVPRYLAVLVGMTPMLVNALWYRLDLPGIDDPRFVPWAAMAALVLLLVCAWRWRQLLRAGGTQASGWSSPLVLQFRSGSWGYWNDIGDNRQLSRRPDWLRPAIDLAGVGPAKPRKSLRVALGGWYLPQTAASYGKQLALMFGVLALPMACVTLVSRIKSTDDDAATLAGGIVGALCSFLVVAAPMICIFSLLWLSKRWKRTNAELPLLALLPGLGDPAGAKRLLLRTVLGLPLALHGLLVLLLGMVMLFWHGHAYMLSFMLLAQVGGAVVTAAVLLNLFGGRALSPWSIGLILVVANVLTMASLLLPALALGREPMAQAMPLLPLLPLGWLLLAGAMAWLGRRGWHRLMQQPHPFLPG